MPPALSNKAALFRYVIAFWGLALICLHLYAHFSDRPGLWGVDSWRSFSTPVAVALALTGLIFIIPFTSACLRPLFERLFSRVLVVLRLFGGYPAATVLAAGAGCLFWTWRCRIHLLGDGYWWARNLERGAKFWHNEPLAVYFNWLARRVLSLAGEVSAEQAFQVVSCLCGMVFIYVLFFLARKLGRTDLERVLIFFGIASLGMVQLFFGYVETYPPLVALLVVYIHAAVRRLRDQGSVFWPALVFWLLVLTHVSAAVAGPSLLFLYLYEWKSLGAAGGRYRLVKMLIGLLGPVAVASLFAWAIGLRPETFTARHGQTGHLLLPLVNSDSRYFSYAFLSGAHLGDLANLVLLVCPWLLLAGLLPVVRPMSGISRTCWFLILLSFFPLASIVFFNSELGLARDWDLLSYTFIAPALLGVMLLNRLLRREQALLGYAAGVIIALGFLGTVPWILVNADTARSLDRYGNLLDTEVLRSVHARAFGHEEIAIYYRDRGQLPRAVWHYKKAIEADPGSYRLYAGLASLYHMLGEKDKVLACLLKSLEAEPDSPKAHFNLGLFYQQEEQFDEAEPCYRKTIELSPGHTKAIANLGSVFFHQGKVEDAIYLYRYALERAPDDEATRENLETALRIKRMKADRDPSASDSLPR
ncbi:MAG: tetratricopeptide repeat protein [Gemmatimonadota bacterium]|nr:tetratricopeptide repeat protein [Gemmatimonadota bacterium]